VNQQYKLSPNPNSGNLTVMQMIPDDEPVKVEIWNAVGMSVYKTSLQFNNGTAQMKLGSVAPGIYLMQLNDTKGNRFIFKFVVE